MQKEIYNVFVEKLVAKMKASVVGGPKDDAPAPAYCSLISSEHRAKVQGMVDRAVAAGAQVLCGGQAVEGAGYRFQPTVLVGAAQDSEIMQKEIFGPVLPVTSFDTFDEALKLANDCEYGLTSSLFTENYRFIERARTELLFGETYINRFHFEAMQGTPPVSASSFVCARATLD